MFVSERMATDLITIGSDSTIAEAKDEMSKNSIRHLPVIDDDTYDYQKLNVAAQEADPDSILNWTRFLISTRQGQSALRAGAFQWVETGGKETIAFRRRAGEDEVLCLFNLSDKPQKAHFNLEASMVNLLAREKPILPAGEIHRLEPFAAHWLIPAA